MGSSQTPRAGSHSERRRRASGSAEDDADAVCRAVVRERDAGAGQRLIVERDGRDSTRHPARVLDCYLVARRVIAERDLEAAPRARDARIHVEEVAAQAEPENPLDADGIRAARRPAGPGYT